MPELYQTISTLWIAIALLGCAGLAWDAARRYMQLAHGRMLSADRSQTFERAITQLETRVKGIASTADDDRVRSSSRYDDHVACLNINANKFVNIEAELADIKKNFGVAYGAQDKAISGWRDFTDQRFAEAATWQQKAEQSIVLLQGEVDKRDKAIVSCVEEIRAIREQQAMALAGVANLPARGFAGKQRTP